jgi:hypothetical protein
MFFGWAEQFRFQKWLNCLSWRNRSSCKFFLIKVFNNLH